MVVVVALAVLAVVVWRTRQRPDYLVGAYYYGWYDAGHWAGLDYLGPHLPDPLEPGLGRYDSRDPDVVDAHVRWASEYGIDFLILVSPALPSPAIDVAHLEKIQFGLALSCLLLVTSHLSVMSGSAVAARKSIQLLTHGKWAVLFIGGVIGAGLVIPLLVSWPLLWQASFQTMFAVTAVLALLRLFGDYLFRFLVIRAGLYDPLL